MVNHAQSAFTKGRKIYDNILLAHDLMQDYHKASGPHKVAAKLDLMKAYDSVKREFLINLLNILDFPPKMLNWIKMHVTIFFSEKG